MSAPPYMKLYVADYLADTTHLTVCQHGAYLLLLMAMWRAGGSLPLIDANLARITRCSPDQWAEMRADVVDLFQVSDDRITHKRLSAEMGKYADVVTKRSEAGKASAEKKRQEINTPASTHVEHMFPKPEPEPEPERKNPPKAPQGALFEDAWKAFPPGGRERSHKGQSQDAWDAAAARVGAEDLLAAIEVYAITPDARREGGRFVPAMQRWLKGARYEHFLGLLPLSITPPSQDDEWRKRVRGWVHPNKYWDVDDWGPRPGREGCACPPAILREFNIEPAPLKVASA